jgi:Metallo-peptidase family M12/Secretion system C-terminal sorting domain
MICHIPLTHYFLWTKTIFLNLKLLHYVQFNSIQFNSIRLFVASLFFIWANFMTAQVTFSLKEVALPKAVEEKVKTQVTEFQAYEINLPLFNRFLKGHSSTDTIPIKLNIGKMHSIDYRVMEYEVRAKNCMEIAIKSNETELKELGRCDTYREIAGNSSNRRFLLFASSEYFNAHFYINNEAYELVSLASFDGESNKNIVILHKESKVLKKPFTCGNTNLPTIVDNQQTAIIPEGNAIRFVELAIVADYEYAGVNNQGYSYNVVRSRIDNEMMLVNDLFETEFNLTFIIVHREIWLTTSQFQFSYPFSGTSQNRWEQLRTYYNKISPNNPPSESYVGKRACIDRDAVLLFSNNGGARGTVDGSAGGTGFNKLCGTDLIVQLSNPLFCNDKNGFAYAVVNSFDWKTTAHELAHLFGAPHSSCGIMCTSNSNCRACTKQELLGPGIIPVNFTWLPNVKGEFLNETHNDIWRHIYGTGQFPLACPPHAPGSCLLNEPNLNTPFVEGNDVVCGWGNFNIDTGADAVWEAQDPYIIRSSGGFPYAGQSIQIMSNVPGYHTIKVSFQHNCIPVVLYKSIWFGPPQLPEVYTVQDACDNGSGTCSIFEVSFNKANTRYIDNFTLTPQNCSNCNFYTTGSFALGTITVWNVHAGECVSVSGNAYNECGSTDFSQTFCNTNANLIAKNELIIFPNPTNSSFSVGTISKGVITVWNILGEKIATFTKDDYPKVDIDTKAWSSGTYIVKFDSDSGTMTKKVSVSH